jgi:GTPase SAR1 family protein
MLPSEPKIFHGRDSELSDILQLFNQGTPRIAILGSGGMGKTSLARAVIHHAQIKTRYQQHCFFVACDSASSTVELAALIGVNIGLKPGRNLSQAVVQHFSSSPSSLLVLDNLETLWEPMECRSDIEEFLSLLADIEHLALMVSSFFPLYGFAEIVTDNNARGTKTWENAVDKAFFAASQAFGSGCCSKNIH